MADNCNQKSPPKGSGDGNKLFKSLSITASEAMRLIERDKKLGIVQAPRPTCLISNATPISQRSKTSSFQITSIKIDSSRTSSSSRTSDGDFDDSADDLDESHTDDFSMDNSRITDIENETPSFSEDTSSKDDNHNVNVITNPSLNSVPVVSATTTIIPAAPATLVDTNNVTTSSGVSVSDTTINPIKPKCDTKPPGARFKVVKIESAEPFKRGRWMCMDYLDCTLSQHPHSQHIKVMKPMDGKGSTGSVQQKASESSVAVTTSFPNSSSQMSLAQQSDLLNKQIQQINQQALLNRQVANQQAQAVNQQAQVINQTNQQNHQPLPTQYMATQQVNIPQPVGVQVMCQQQTGMPQGFVPVQQMQGQSLPHVQIQQQFAQGQAMQQQLQGQSLSLQHQMPLLLLHQRQQPAQQSLSQQSLSQQSLSQQSLSQQSLSQQSLSQPVQQTMQGQSLSQQTVQGQNLSQQSLSQPAQQTMQGQNLSQQNLSQPAQQIMQGQSLSQQTMQGQNLSQPAQQTMQGQNLSQQTVQGQSLSQPAQQTMQGQSLSQPAQQTMQHQSLPPQQMQQVMSQPNVSQHHLLQQQHNMPAQQFQAQYYNQGGTSMQLIPPLSRSVSTATNPSTSAPVVTLPPSTQALQQQQLQQLQQLQQQQQIQQQMLNQQSMNAYPPQQQQFPPVQQQFPPVQQQQFVQQQYPMHQVPQFPVQQQQQLLQQHQLLQNYQNMPPGPGFMVAANYVYEPYYSQSTGASCNLVPEKPRVAGEMALHNLDPLAATGSRKEAVGTPTASSEEVATSEDTESASGSSAVAIDNKIEQAMDLVKSHLMFAVREEVEVLKEKIAELMERISHLEVENNLLRSHATQETLTQLNTLPSQPPGSVSYPQAPLS